MEKQQSSGSVKIKQIKRAYELWPKHVRQANVHKLRVEKLISKFPKKERDLHKEQLQKYKSKLI